jgi:peptidoglycan/xylan/chitin deacetylase (PgdA/CDA1 family)
MPHDSTVIPLAGDTKLACITVDVEYDFGARVKEFKICRDNQAELADLKQYFKSQSLPLTAFVQTQLLEDSAEQSDFVKGYFDDFHAHSHTHKTSGQDFAYEISKSREIFRKHFGYSPVGYRAPQGVICPGYYTMLEDAGYSFSSSIFPSFRPGKFNNLRKPLRPYRVGKAVVELPMAALPAFRLITSMSYLKLFGWGFYKTLYSMAKTPPVIIFDSHLHDYIPNASSYRELPLAWRMIYSRNRNNSLKLFDAMVAFLKKRGYEFVTCTELFRRVAGPHGA